MPEAIITFSKCIQDSQDCGSDDEHMVSRVFFTLKADGVIYELTCDVKQAVGAAFESSPLEVSRPRGYDGCLDYAPFREAVERYYRSLVGAAGRGIHIEGARNVRMRNNVFAIASTVRVLYSSTSQGW